ncbi:MAG: DUF6785 family protein [Phycisphaeraceae bacterium]
MTRRAIFIGLLLGLGIASTTYFNDRVINQTQLIGNELPIGVFGPMILLLLVFNPVMRLFSRRYTLKVGELAVIVVMGLAVCGWPGSGFFRTLTTSVAMPTHFVRNNAAWRTTGVMSFVPGGAARIAPGQVVDWPGLIDKLRAASQVPIQSVGGRVWAMFPAEVQQMLPVDQPATGGDSELETAVLDVLNDMIEPRAAGGDPSPVLWQQINDASLPPAAKSDAAEYQRLMNRVESLTARRDRVRAEYQRLMSREESPTAQRDRLVLRTKEDHAAAIASLNRSIIYQWRQAARMSHLANRRVVESFAGGAIAGWPEGDGLLLANGDDDPFVVDTLVRGWDGARWLRPWELPWRAWWPTLRLWGGLALLMGVISLCLVLVVHPQWSQRELLPYPIVRFVDELTVPGPYGWLPLIARNRLFWIGLVGVMFIHLVDGLHAWFPAVPEIPLSFNFWGLGDIMPNAVKVNGAYGLFGARLYPSIIAFAFFLSTEVSLSLGLSMFVWVFLGAILLSNGVPLENSGESVTLGSMLRTGAYLGSAMMILYVGRRYYTQLLGGMLGMKRHAETPGYAVTAARVGAVCTALAVLLLKVWAGLDWQIGVLVIGLILLMMLVITRINAETGAFFIQSAWMPIAVLTGLLGMQGLGPEAFVVTAMVSIIIAVDPRELITPFLANGLKMAEDVGGIAPARSTRMIGAMVFTGFAAALVATLIFQYNKGASVSDGWARETVASMSFNLTSQQLSAMSAQGSLADSVNLRGWEHFTHASVNGKAVSWLMIGLALVVLCAVARLRLPWWPLHPVIFLVWGTYAMAVTAFSFMIGWAIKATVMKFMGTRGYRKVLPLMVGVIAGEVVAAIGWALVGAAYYFITHTAPVGYSILPG